MPKFKYYLLCLLALCLWTSHSTLWGLILSSVKWGWYYCQSQGLIREGNGKPLQHSCLENTVGRGALWAAIHGVTQSQTWLKWLNSSSSKGWYSTDTYLCTICENTEMLSHWLEFAVASSTWRPPFLPIVSLQLCSSQPFCQGLCVSLGSARILPQHYAQHLSPQDMMLHLLNVFNITFFIELLWVLSELMYADIFRIIPGTHYLYH